MDIVGRLDIVRRIILPQEMGVWRLTERFGLYSDG